jgi:hypothetical protein
MVTKQIRRSNQSWQLLSSWPFLAVSATFFPVAFFGSFFAASINIVGDED